MNEWIQGRVLWFQHYLGFDDESLERAKQDASYSAKRWWADARRKRWLAVAFIYEAMTFVGLWLIQVIFSLPPLPLWYRWVIEITVFGAMWLVLYGAAEKMASIEIKESRRLAFWSGAFFLAMALVPAVAFLSWGLTTIFNVIGW